MDDKGVEALPPEAFTRGLKKLNQREPAKKVVILGFDTEYDSVTHEIVCYQLSDGDWAHSELLERTKDFSWKELSEWVLDCLRKWGYSMRDCVTIMLVSHFSTAELSHVERFWEEANIRRVSPQQVYNATYRINDYQRLYVMDQYHFFNTGLAKVAATFGHKKLDYDTTKVTRDSLKDPKFREYALWDAVICAKVFTEFRRRLLHDYQVDVVHYPTPASLAMAVYRQHFMPGDLPAPDEKVRRQAWLSLWGGRAEAFVQGDFLGGFTLRDVKSLYPTSARILRELPTALDWVQREEPVSWQGICRVHFEFPSSTMYPCLPVFHEGKLYFPLSGVSDCTLEEARVAKLMGAMLHFQRVFEYDRGDDSLAKFMDYFVKEKDDSEKKGDKVGRELAKLMMNALIGKFSQHRGSVDIEDLKKAAATIGVPLEVVLNPSFHHPAKPRDSNKIGGHIMPEWSALILGKARAIMAQLLTETEEAAKSMDLVSSLICSTDSMLVPDELNATVDRAMGQVGVILTSKNEVFKQVGDREIKVPNVRTARVRVVRNRAYAAESAAAEYDVKDEKVKIDAGEIVFGAAHAVHLSRRASQDCDDCEKGVCRNPLHDSLRFVLSDVTKYEKIQRLGLKTAIRTGKRFFDDRPQPMTFKREWDNKRKLLPDGTTRPWASMQEYEEAVST